MSAFSKKSKEINLLPIDRFIHSPLGRILAWLLKTFRIIVMAVEMVVMVAFLSRFWLDARNSDLNDEIKQKRTIIESQDEFITEFENIQTKLKIASQILASAERPSDEIKLITTSLPQDVYLSSIILANDGVQLKGFSLFERSISQLIVNLKASDKFDEVKLISLEAGETESGFIEFGLSATRKDADARKLEE